MTGDWDKQPLGIKDAWTYKKAIAMRINCGAFLHWRDRLKLRISESEFESIKADLMAQFLSGSMDYDLTAVLQNSVPPADVKSIAYFRPTVGVVGRVLWVLCVLIISHNCHQLLSFALIVGAGISWRHLRKRLPMRLRNGMRSWRLKLPTLHWSR